MGELFDESVVLSNDTGPSASSGLEAMAKNQRAIKELEGAQAPQSKTITSGSISPTAAYVIVDTEGSAAADDLSVISPVLSASENLHVGMIVYLKAADSGRVVTVKNSSSANGINTYDGNDYALSTTHWLKLQLRADGKWYEVEGRAMEAATAAATAAAAASTPATTTARGIGRVATAEDAAVGSDITNGPAFLDAATWKVSATPANGVIPLANSNGKLDAWVSPDAGKANNDLSNLEPAAEEVIRSKTTLKNLGTRSTTGSWTITGVEIGRLLLISVAGFDNTIGQYSQIKAISGLASTGDVLLGSRGVSEAYALGLSEPYYPTSETVVINVQRVDTPLSLVARQ